MKVLVLGNAQKSGVTEEVERSLPLLQDKVEVLAVDLRQEVDLTTLPSADVAFVFGGDGAMLRAARQMGYRQVPVMGINLGRLGFLADIPPQEFATRLEQVLAGQARVTQHLMYECLILEEGRAEPSHTFLGLNEVVVHTLPPFHLLELELEIDGDTVAGFGVDGLIISTPIGSTGHNLSAGGPILEQQLAAFAITPICAHTLTYRPIVETADKEFRIRMSRVEKQAMVIVDGQETVEIGPKHQVMIRRAPVVFQLLKVPGRSYYQTLRDKLRWATQPRQRTEP